MKKILGITILSLLSILSFYIPKLNASTIQHNYLNSNWTAYNYYADYWGMRLEANLSNYDDIIINIPASSTNTDYRGSIYATVYLIYGSTTKTIIIDNPTLTSGMTIVINDTYLESLGFPTGYSFYDSIIISIPQTTNYNGGLGVPSGYVDFWQTNALVYERYLAGYTVNYLVLNEIYYTETVISGVPTVPATPPLPDGTTFEGWYTNDNTLFDFLYVNPNWLDDEGQLNLTAKFKSFEIPYEELDVPGNQIMKKYNNWEVRNYGGYLGYYLKADLHRFVNFGGKIAWSLASEFSIGGYDSKVILTDTESASSVEFTLESWINDYAESPSLDYSIDYIENFLTLYVAGGSIDIQLFSFDIPPYLNFMDIPIIFYDTIEIIVLHNISYSNMTTYQSYTDTFNRSSYIVEWYMDSFTAYFYDRLMLYDIITAETIHHEYRDWADDPIAPEGYRFIGWKTENGDLTNGYIDYTNWLNEANEIKLYSYYLPVENVDIGIPSGIAPDGLVSFLTIFGLNNTFGRVFFALVVIVALAVLLAILKASLIIYLVVITGLLVLFISFNFIPLFVAIILFLVLILIAITGFNTKGGEL